MKMQQENDDLAGVSDEEMAITHRVSGELYMLFIEKCRPFIKTNSNYKYLDVEALADVLGLTRQSIYPWFRKNKLTPARVNQLLKLKGCLFTQADLVPYLLND